MPRKLLDQLDLIEFLKDHDIPYEVTGKNIGSGWVGIEDCLWCNSGNFHLGIDINTKGIHCWVCGANGTLLKFLMMYYHISLAEAIDMIKLHIAENDFEKDMDIEEQVRAILTEKEDNTKKEIEQVKEIEPIGEFITEELIANKHTFKLRQFLKARGLNVEICQEHNILYEHDWCRIIIPIYSPEGDCFAYQARDVTGLARLKYITKPDGVNITNTLYNIENLAHELVAIVVEGALDVLNIENWVKNNLVETIVLGCFTNKPSTNQLNLLSGCGFDKIISMLDHDSWFNYRKFNDLSMDIEPIVLPVGKDPGDLTSRDLNKLFFTS